MLPKRGDTNLMSVRSLKLFIDPAPDALIERLYRKLNKGVRRDCFGADWATLRQIDPPRYEAMWAIDRVMTTRHYQLIIAKSNTQKVREKYVEMRRFLRIRCKELMTSWWVVCDKYSTQSIIFQLCEAELYKRKEHFVDRPYFR